MLAVIAVALAAGMLGSGPARSHGRSTARQPALVASGPTDPARRIQFGIALRLRGGALHRSLARFDRPGPQSTKTFLSAGEFGARFGLSSGSLQELRGRLRGFGLSVGLTYRQRTEMLVRGSVARVSRLFHVHFVDLRSPSGQLYYEARGRPTVPARLARYVTGVGELGDVPLTSDDIPATGLTPQIVSKAYDITPLWNDGILGKGQRIAVVSEGKFNYSDIQAWQRKTGSTTTPSITSIPVGEGSPAASGSAGGAEDALDLQVILSVAPQASILQYEIGQQTTGFSVGLADAFNKIVEEDRAKIVSVSLGECEPAIQPGEQELVENALAAADRLGITVFVASGDTGAYACEQDDPSDTALSVQFPSSSPYVLAVGGTRLSVAQDGSYVDEQAWSDPLERTGSGGGVSAGEPKPSWQQGPGVDTPSVNPQEHRQTPDVAGPADPSSGFLVCHAEEGSGREPCASGNGGTSAATPFWAASMLLVQQYASGHGVGNTEFAAPMLYALAANPQSPAPFHDVVHGNNGYYPATNGWDYATGLGSPDVYSLAQDYLTYSQTGR
jgi:subtilase family serine protease